MTTVRPPSTGTVAPVMKLASSESRWATVAATSSGRPARPTGAGGRARASIRSATSGGCATYSSWKRDVTIEPGATALTRIPRAPYSTASARVSPSVAALAVT